MSKRVELRRHTASDGDLLSKEGVRAALEIGSRLTGGYEVAVSSGAQRATQTIACFIAGLGQKVPRGVLVDERLRSDVEDRWFEAYDKAGAGDLGSFKKADPDLVEAEAEIFADALRDIFDQLSVGTSALVVGHSPMQEAAVYGLTGEIVEPLGKGAGVVVTQEDSGYRVESLT